MTSVQLKRLHVSPLSPDLLPSLLGSESASIAKNVSYYDIQTFPEKSYGYIDLPVMDADKVKKKLNGAILKGQKLKIEDARPQKRKLSETEEPSQHTASTDTGDSNAKKSKKSKKDQDAIAGRELSPDRKVKRGWTEQKSPGKKEKKERAKSDRAASKYTDKEELLFRTKLPENKADLGSSKKKKSKQAKDSQTVHEFEKSVTQPSFLKDSSGSKSRPNLEYVDEQGWVDAEGNVVEKEPSNLRERRKAKKAKKAKAVQEESETPATERSEQAQGSSPSSHSQQSPPKEDSNARLKPSASQSPASDTTPRESQTSEAQQLHPLEALFKKPQIPAPSQDVAKPSLEVQTSFSFFEGVPDEDIQEEEPPVPGTPFNSQDARSRVLRSAAPTPDTAHPSRFNSYGSTGLPGDEQSESDEEDHVEELPESSEKTPLAKSLNPNQQSEFAKMFWEKRGDNNRSWKARRRTVLKEKRQRENRARRPRNW